MAHETNCVPYCYFVRVSNNNYVVLNLVRIAKMSTIKQNKSENAKLLPVYSIIVTIRYVEGRGLHLNHMDAWRISRTEANLKLTLSQRV